MRCYVACLATDPIMTVIQSVVGDICQQFGLTQLIEKKRMPHITLKSPFEIESTNDLERLLAAFAQRNDATAFEITGFGSFNDDYVISAKVQPSPPMLAVHTLLLGKLKKLPGIRESRYDVPDGKTYHITLGKKEELQGQGRNILRYLEQTTLRLTGTFDTLAIMKKEKKQTYVYQSYQLRSL